MDRPAEREWPTGLRSTSQHLQRRHVVQTQGLSAQTVPVTVRTASTRSGPPSATRIAYQAHDRGHAGVAVRAWRNTGGRGRRREAHRQRRRLRGRAHEVEALTARTIPPAPHVPDAASGGTSDTSDNSPSGVCLPRSSSSDTAPAQVTEGRVQQTPRQRRRRRPPLFSEPRLQGPPSLPDRGVKGCQAAKHDFSCQVKGSAATAAKHALG